MLPNLSARNSPFTKWGIQFNESAQLTVGPDFVIVFAPLVDFISSLFRGTEPMHVRAVLSELAVERFNKRILNRFTGLDKLQRDVSFLRPEKHRFAG